MFQDIVETEMFYVAVMGTERSGTEVFNKEFFKNEPSFWVRLFLKLKHMKISSKYMNLVFQNH